MPKQALRIVKGAGMPLNPEQRELVGIFVDYLRHLPINAQGPNWHKCEDLEPLREIMRGHFRRKHRWRRERGQRLLAIGSPADCV